MYHVNKELLSETLVDYLKKRGWMLEESEPDIALLRRTYEDREEEIVLPMDKTYADYQQRITEAIQFLAVAEGRSENQIINELLFQKWDVLQIRISGERIGPGYISYLDKRTIEEGIRKMLLASARYVLDPKIHFKRLYSTTSEQWMKKCRAGLAELGSYILTIQMPLEEKENNFEPPYSRRIAEYFMTTLSKLVKFSENQDLMLSNGDYQLNVNLCFGLAEMKPDEASIDFAFEMKWSPELPIAKTIPTKVEVKDHHLSSIMRIGQKLIPPKSKENQDVFIGRVLVLDGEADEKGKMQGEVTLGLFLEEQQVKAKAFLNSEYYSVVCDAHKHNRYIRVSGVLAEKPRFSDLRDISHLEIID